MNTLGVPSGTGTSVALYSAEQSSGRGDSWGGIVESPGALAVNTQLAQARNISAYLVLVIPQIGEIQLQRLSVCGIVPATCLQSVPASSRGLNALQPTGTVGSPRNSVRCGSRSVTLAPVS